MSDKTMSAGKSSTNGFPGWLVFLGILIAIAPLSIDMYLPSFPQIEQLLKGQPGSAELGQRSSAGRNHGAVRNQRVVMPSFSGQTP